MIREISYLPLPILVPIRFLACPANGLTTSEVKKSLNPIFYQAPSSNEWGQCLQQLAIDGLLKKIGRSRFQITDMGQKQALQSLGLQSMPPTSRWLTLRNRYLIATLLKLPTAINQSDRFSVANANGLRAAILINAFQLAIDSHPTLVKVRDSLLWQQLAQPANNISRQRQLAQSNFMQTKSFTINSAASLLLSSVLGTERELSWDNALKQLAAKAIGARRINPEELRLAILRIATQPQPVSTQPQPLKKRLSQSLQQPEALDLEHFASQMNQSAKRCQTGKFGDNKLFISHVWRQMERDHNTFGLDLNKFKHYLILANNKGLVSLSRADLPYAMDQEDVSTSETPYLNSTFHFIRLKS